MLSRRVGFGPFLVTLAAVAASCAEPLPPETPPAPAPAPVPAAPDPEPVASATPTPPVKPTVLKMYPVQKIGLLMDLSSVDGRVELRIGWDPGGGVSGWEAYAPIVNGRPDLEKQTGSFGTATTTATATHMHGKRPNLFVHKYSGFRSGPTDSYFEQDGKTWKPIKPKSAPGALGLNVFSWSDGRLLEWRGTPALAMGLSDAVTVPPRFRVLRGKDKGVPVVSKAIAAKLTAQKFQTASVLALPSGEVVAVGRPAEGVKLVTLLWTDDLNRPKYFESPEVTAATGLDIELLGGASLSDMRLRVGEELLRLDNVQWKKAGQVTEDEPPDIWFGKPLVYRHAEWDEKTPSYARLTKSGPWLKIEAHPAETELDIPPSNAVDASGVIWRVEAEVLYCSKKPAQELPPITKDQIMAMRKKLGMPDERNGF